MHGDLSNGLAIIQNYWCKHVHGALLANIEKSVVVKNERLPAVGLELVATKMDVE